MATKIEKHPRRAEIEEKIIKGESFALIAAWCHHALKFEISSMAIKRHSDKHNLLRNDGIQEGLDSEQIDDLQDNFKIVGDIPYTEANMRKVFNEILFNQLLIVSQKQRVYMAGEGRYPSSEIMGLKAIAGLFDGRGNLHKIKRLELDKEEENE